jgi:hypothetical protein
MIDLSDVSSTKKKQTKKKKAKAPLLWKNFFSQVISGLDGVIFL